MMLATPRAYLIVFLPHEPLPRPSVTTPILALIVC